MLIRGDARFLPLQEASVDACVTDPPYGIGFMGREWDTFKPGIGKARRLMHPRERKAAAKIVSDNPNINGRHRSPALSPSQIDYDYSTAGLRSFQAWPEEWAREVLRVLKPGAYLVVCGAPRSYHRMACGLEDAGFVIRDKFAWLFGSGFPKNYNLGDGKGTALKPAHEPIALAWKPFKGSIRACHEQHGTAALNIDACRIDGEKSQRGERETALGRMNDDAWQPKPTMAADDLGRWPANVLLDKAAAAALDEQAGELTTGAWPTARGAAKFQDIYQGGFKGQTELQKREANVGGASRFYYVAKPSREERDFGCENERANVHPTVKPIELMRWLVRLVTPVGGTVLDPFTGSGTTGIACRYELRQFVGIEREADYIAIADCRIAAAVPLFSDASA